MLYVELQREVRTAPAVAATASPKGRTQKRRLCAGASAAIRLRHKLEMWLPGLLHVAELHAWLTLCTRNDGRDLSVTACKPRIGAAQKQWQCLKLAASGSTKRRQDAPNGLPLVCAVHETAKELLGLWLLHVQVVACVFQVCNLGSFAMSAVPFSMSRGADIDMRSSNL